MSKAATRKRGEPNPAPLEAAAKELSRLDGGFLSPVASDENIIDGFKRYNALKEKLLESTDYIWYAAYTAGTKDSRKGFKKREDAEAAVKELRSKNINADLEKKAKKSGVMKLSKAFGISCEILEESLDAPGKMAKYRVRASAPNGQFRDRVGVCDRMEKGKGDSPLDTIVAVANTRAEDRAIMALLGGENTAEEFEADPSHDDLRKEDALDREAKDIEARRAREANLTEQEKKNVDAIQEKFASTPPAPPVDKVALLRKMFARAATAEVPPEQLKNGIKQKWNLESTKDMTNEQILVVIEALDDKIRTKAPL